MSQTETQNINDDEVVIPDENDVESPQSGTATWRFAEGKIVSGPKDELVTRDAIIGVVQRVGIHQGVRTITEGGREFQKQIHRIECDIKTSRGVVHLGQSLLNEKAELKPTRSCLDLAWCLLQVQPGKVYSFTAAQGEPWTNPQGVKMSASTYVNIADVLPPKEPGGKSQISPIRRPKRDPSAPKVDAIDQWHQLDAELRKHPLYKEREERTRGGEESNFELLCLLCDHRQWPSPMKATNAWLGMMAKAFKDESPRSALTDYSDDEWGQAKDIIEGLSECPASLKPAAAGAFA